MTTLAEYAERMVDLWGAVNDAYLKRNKIAPNFMTHNVLFERADHHLISDQIGEQKTGQKKQQAQDKDKEGHCSKCGRALTEKEIAFIITNNKPDVCYHCSH